VPGGLLRHVDTGALCHRLYPPPVCGDQFFCICQQPPGPRGPRVVSLPHLSARHASAGAAYYPWCRRARPRRRAKPAAP